MGNLRPSPRCIGKGIDWVCGPEPLDGLPGEGPTPCGTADEEGRDGRERRTRGEFLKRDNPGPAAHPVGESESNTTCEHVAGEGSEAVRRALQEPQLPGLDSDNEPSTAPHQKGVCREDDPRARGGKVRGQGIATRVVRKEKSVTVWVRPAQFLEVRIRVASARLELATSGTSDQ